MRYREQYLHLPLCGSPCREYGCDAVCSGSHGTERPRPPWEWESGSSAEPGPWWPHGTTTCPGLLITSRLHSQQNDRNNRLAELTTFCCVQPYTTEGGAGQGSGAVIHLQGHYISSLSGSFKTTPVPSCLFKLLSMLLTMFPDLQVLKFFSTCLFSPFVSLFSSLLVSLHLTFLKKDTVSVSGSKLLKEMRNVSSKQYLQNRFK